MKLKLHVLANREVTLNLKCENKTEEELIQFFFKDANYKVNLFNGNCGEIGLSTGKYFKK